jgi:hypothetical protein
MNIGELVAKATDTATVERAFGPARLRAQSGAREHDDHPVAWAMSGG